MDFWDKLHFLHRCYRYKYHTEKQQLGFVAANLRKGAVGLDIGANKGIYSYWMSKIVGAKGVIHAFEPQPEMIREIERVKSWFSLENLRVHNVALSSKKGEALLGRSHAGDGGASIESTGQVAEKIKVKTITLDEALKSQGITAVDFIKCDVEGHELSVFAGAVETLSSSKPVLLFEGRVEEKGLSELFVMLEGLGYAGVMLLDGKFPDYRAYKTMPSRKFGLAGHRDFVFTHKSRPVILCDKTRLGG